MGDMTFSLECPFWECIFQIACVLHLSVEPLSLILRQALAEEDQKVGYSNLSCND